MRKVYSKDTGKELGDESEFKADVRIEGGGEGGVYFGMCWHEMRELGSAVVHWTPEQAKQAIKAIQAALSDLD